MSEVPSEELVEKMMPALNELAQLITYGARPDSKALKGILMQAGLANDKKAIDELEQWCQILQEVHDIPDDSSQRAAAIAGLLERGVHEAPATLAVERSASQAVAPQPDIEHLIERLSEDVIEKMMPALSELAQRIGYVDKPDSEALKGILSKAGLAKDKKAIDELEQWCQILQEVHDMPDDSSQRAAAIAGLLERGVREAPATLAVVLAGGESIIVEPDAADFGLLRSGEAASATLTVSGRLRDVEPRSKRLSVALHRSGPTRTLVKIMLTAGKPGESLNDEVVLRGEGVEISVPVMARWAVEQPAVSKSPQVHQPLKVCPTCNARGIHGEGSLFWNWRDKKWECLNWKCPDFRLTDTPKGRR